MARHEDISADISGEIPSELQDLASQIRSMPGDAPEGLEARVFGASVGALREGRAAPAGVAGRIGPMRWLAPVAAAAAVGLLAWAGASWFGPAAGGPSAPQQVSTVALDEHVSDVLEYADLFSDMSWGTTLAEDAEELDEGWELTVDSWSLESETGAS